MTAKTCHDLIIAPTLHWLGKDSPEARVLLLAIAITESGLRTRLQQPVAHAKGLWQFEKNGGCAAIETHASLGWCRAAIDELGFSPAREKTWAAIGQGADTLACIMARGLLWPDAHPLPALSDVDGAFAYYDRCWQPGKPSPSRFATAYTAAIAVVRGL